MSYTLEKFGTTLLPQARPTTDIGAAEAFSLLTPLPSGGAYDALGSGRSRGKPININHTAAVVGAGTTAVQTLLDGLKGMVGKRDRLYRRLPDGSLEWITARLVTVAGQRKIDNINYLDLNLAWQSGEYYWHGLHHGPDWVLDAGYYLDAGLAFDQASGDVTIPLPASGSVTVNNGGNYPVRNAIITIYSGGVAITGLTIILSGATSLTFAGTLASGKYLVIDTGKYSVLNDGVDNFTNLTRQAGHVIAEWLCLEPGNNTVALTRTGGDGSSSITFTYDDGWA